jgi:hypothetical protein
MSLQIRNEFQYARPSLAGEKEMATWKETQVRLNRDKQRQSMSYANGQVRLAMPGLIVGLPEPMRSMSSLTEGQSPEIGRIQNG